MAESSGKYETAASRWAGVGPYYAMFPTDFANHVVQKYTDVGESVLDPFSGRGTSIFSAATNGRIGMGVELNPVGWVYSQAKLHPAKHADVIERIREIGKLSSRRRSLPDLPVFFSWCFSPRIQQFLFTARKHLDWRRNPADWTLMALLLVNMHGKRDAALSNQMRQTKSMSPNYAVNWWKAHDSHPPDVDPVEFMEKRVNWRYAKGQPSNSNSFVYLGNSIDRCVMLAAEPPNCLFHRRRCC